MSFFDDLFKQLFSKENKEANIDLNEKLVRTDEYVAAYSKWKDSGRPEEFLNKIEKAFQLKQSGVESEINISIYNSVYANGFFFTFNSDIDEKDFIFMFDFFKERVLNMGYFLSTSYKRLRDKNNYIEEIQKHFLKPKNESYEGILDQLYGNILIEYVIINNKSSYIKIMANIYSDSKFKKALEFDEFTERLLGRF